MKKIIDGITCNTETATLIVAYDHEDGPGYTNLYKTKGGHFFAEGYGDCFSRYAMPASEPGNFVGGSGIVVVDYDEVPAILTEAHADEDEWEDAGFKEDDYAESAY